MKNNQGINDLKEPQIKDTYLSIAPYNSISKLHLIIYTENGDYVAN